jgi:hypothetical protein
VFKNRVLWRIFGPKRGEVTGKWRKLHTQELYMYPSPNIIRVIKSRIPCAGHIARMERGEVRTEEPEGKRPLGRHRCSWEDIIKMIFRKWHRGHGME